MVKNNEIISRTHGKRHCWPNGATLNYSNRNLYHKLSHDNVTKLSVNRITIFLDYHVEHLGPRPRAVSNTKIVYKMETNL